jgi:amidase
MPVKVELEQVVYLGAQNRMIDPALLPATELLAALRERRISSRELLEHQLQRVEHHNRKLNAVLSLDAERALAEADVADEARARGRDLGPLHGLPMTLKDAFEDDSDAVLRLRAAGAIVFGRTNAPAAGDDGRFYNPPFGHTNNPWDTTRTTGGSAGGSAAAVAAGLSSLELGIDLAGSVRRPAHFCGVYGLKPSWGAVPAGGHETDMSAIGPMARGVDDLELALDVLAGPDDAEAIAWNLELPPPRAAWLGDYRVAVWLDDPVAPVDAEVLSVLRAAADSLADTGLEMVERPAPVQLSDARRIHKELLMGVYCSGMAEGAFAALKQLAATTPHSEDESEAMRRARLLTQTKRDWSAADEERRAMRVQWAELFLEFDAFLCPVASHAAPPHDLTPDLDARTITINGEPRPYWDQLAWIAYASTAYLPAVSVPVGLTESHLPVGLQVVAPYLEDRTALDVARRVSQVMGGFEAPPAFGTGVTARA